MLTNSLTVSNEKKCLWFTPELLKHHHLTSINNTSCLYDYYLLDKILSLFCVIFLLNPMVKKKWNRDFCHIQIVLEKNKQARDLVLIFKLSYLYKGLFEGEDLSSYNKICPLHWVQSLSFPQSWTYLKILPCHTAKW